MSKPRTSTSFTIAADLDLINRSQAYEVRNDTNYDVDLADKIIAALRKFRLGLTTVGIMVQVGDRCRADVEQALRRMLEAEVIEVSADKRYKIGGGK